MSIRFQADLPRDSRAVFAQGLIEWQRGSLLDVFSALIRDDQIREAMPQVRHGDSVMWRTENDRAPLAPSTNKRRGHFPLPSMLS
jgi:hypothetical protein